MVAPCLKQALVGLSLCLIVGASSAQAPSSVPVWFWRIPCGDRGLAIDVTLSGRSVYHAEVPICHMVRTRDATTKENNGFKILLTTSKPLVFSGYRDTDDVVPAGKSLEMDIWEAGADPDDLIIGVSVADGKKIYMNTVLIAEPKIESGSAIANDLFVTVKPIKLKP